MAISTIFFRLLRMQVCGSSKLGSKSMSCLASRHSIIMALPIAHCDLKLQNVLIFRAASQENRPLEVTYQTKLCDSGFSVIMSDYEEDASLCEQLASNWFASMDVFNARTNQA
jgi:serine/threonine protein kinase